MKYRIEKQSWLDWPRKKRKTTQNTKIRYEKGDITNNLTEIKKFTENTINNGMVTS